MMLRLLGMITSGQHEQYCGYNSVFIPYTDINTGYGKTDRPMTYAGQTRYRRTAGPIYKS